MEKIIQNLSFEVVAVPQDVTSTTTSNVTPIKVKVKMKKVDDRGIPRRGIISVPKMKPTNPGRTRTVHSDETIMSFNMHLDHEPELTSRRKSQNKFLHLFKTGICLGTQGEDEDKSPYTLATTVQSNNIQSERALLELRDTNNMRTSSKDRFKIKSPKDVSKSHNVIFGKCKPGGCLDPPFGEDNYQYYPPVLSQQSLKRNETEKLQKISCTSTGKHKRKNKNLEVAIKNSEYNESDESSTYMLYRANSKNKSLNEKYSDSIITYPTRTSSRDLSILEKSIMSRKSNSIRDRQLKSNTFFSPTKRRKSPEINVELVNKENTQRKNFEKEVTNSNLEGCNDVPKSDHLQVTTLLENSNDNNKEELKTANSQELVTHPNYTFSQFVEVSGNILLTIHQTKEPIDIFTSKSDEVKMQSKIQEFKEATEYYRSSTEKEIPKQVNIASDEVPILNIPSTSSLECSKDFQKFDEFTNTLLNTVQTTSEIALNQEVAKNNYIRSLKLECDQEMKKLLHVQLNENLNDEGYKENITNPTEITINNKQDSRIIHDTQENIKKHSPIDYLYPSNTNNIDLSNHDINTQILSLLDLKLISENLKNIEQKDSSFNIKKSNEKIYKHITDALNIDELSMKNVSSNKTVSADYATKVNNKKNLINHEYNVKDNMPGEKTSSHIFNPTKGLKNTSGDYNMENVEIIMADDKVTTLQEENIIQIEEISKKEKIVNTPLDIYPLKEHVSLSDTQLIKKIKIDSVQNNNINANNISETDTFSTSGKQILKDGFVENIFNNTSIENIISYHVEDASSTMITDKNIKTLSNIEDTNSDKKFIEDLQTSTTNKAKRNDTAEIHDTKVAEKLMEREELRMSETILTEPPFVNLNSYNMNFTLHGKDIKDESEPETKGLDKAKEHENLRMNDKVFNNVSVMDILSHNTEHRIKDSPSYSILEKNDNTEIKNKRELDIGQLDKYTESFQISETIFSELPITNLSSQDIVHALEDSSSIVTKENKKMYSGDLKSETETPLINIGSHHTQLTTQKTSSFTVHETNDQRKIKNERESEAGNIQKVTEIPKLGTDETISNEKSIMSLGSHYTQLTLQNAPSLSIHEKNDNKKNKNERKSSTGEIEKVTEKEKIETSDAIFNEPSLNFSSQYMDEILQVSEKIKNEKESTTEESEEITQREKLRSNEVTSNKTLLSNLDSYSTEKRIQGIPTSTISEINNYKETKNERDSDTENLEKLTEKENIITSDTVVSEEPLINLGLQYMEGTLQNSSSSTVTENNKNIFKDIKNEKESTTNIAEKLTEIEKLQKNESNFNEIPLLYHESHLTEHRILDIPSTSVSEKTDIKVIKNGRDSSIVKLEKDTERSFKLSETFFYHEQSVVNSDLKYIEYTSQTSPTPTGSEKNENIHNTIYKIDREPSTYNEDKLALNKSYQAVSEIENDTNIYVQHILNGILSAAEKQTFKINEKVSSNSSEPIHPETYIKDINGLIKPHNTVSKQNLSTPSNISPLDFKTNTQIVTKLLSAETKPDFIIPSALNTIRTEENDKIQYTSNNKYANESLEKTQNNKNKSKDIEGVQLRDYTKQTEATRTYDTNNNVTVDLGFQAYVNENGAITLRTFDTSQEPQRFSHDRIFITKSVLKINDSKLSFAINSNTILSLKMDRHTDDSDETTFSIEENLAEDTKQETHRSKVLEDVSNICTLEESLFAIYEKDLVPIERLIKNLRLEIDRMTRYRHLASKKNISFTKKLRPTYSRRCICTKKWNN